MSKVILSHTESKASLSYLRLCLKSKQANEHGLVKGFPVSPGIKLPKKNHLGIFSTLRLQTRYFSVTTNRM